MGDNLSKNGGLGIEEQRRVEAAVLAERNRLARDLHDTLAQGFTGIIMQLEAAKGSIERNELVEAVEHVSRAEDLARSSLDEVRRSVQALRPESLGNGTLCTALEKLFKCMSDGSGLTVGFQAQGEERSLSPEWEKVLLRVAQESLTNTIKHARARNFRAALHFSCDQVRMRLEDDGAGFDLQKEHDGFGLIGMKERVDALGGQFVLQSKPGEGTRVSVILPQTCKSQPDNRHEQK